MGKTEYDYSKLKGKIVEVCGTQNVFAERIGRTKTFVSKFLNGKTFMSQSDISNSAIILKIPHYDIGIYFFNEKVHKSETENTQ